MTLSPPIEPTPTLLSAPIELAGNWGQMLPRSADLVLDLMRHSCLDGVDLVSDRQPTRGTVLDYTAGGACGPGRPSGSLGPTICRASQTISAQDLAYSEAPVDNGGPL
jgi:hypothetical protein